MVEPAIRVSVTAIAERAGRFLMVEEAIEGERRVFNQLAGHLEPGETLVEGVCREVLEETAYRFEPAGLVGLYLYPNTLGQAELSRGLFPLGALTKPEVTSWSWPRGMSIRSS